MDLKSLLKEDIHSTEVINKGFSEDKKIIVNKKYIVRVISKDRIPKFKEVFETQKKFFKVALCQKPIDLLEDKYNGYYITEYLEGYNGLEVINTFTEEEQYNFGVQAGKELTKFHKKHPKKEFDVTTYLQTYVTNKIENARIHNVKEYIPNIEEVITIVEKNLHHLFQLEGVLTHSDYHLFNMIFDKNEYKGVIDFERQRVGILFVDFRNNTPHNSTKSPHFASGFIDGYLDEIPIKNFFLMYNIHDLILSIASIPWIIEHDFDNLDRSIKIIKEIISQKNNLNAKPKWYLGKY